MKLPHARHETIVLDVRTRFEYDVTYLSDRFVVDAICGDRHGYSAVMIPLMDTQDVIDAAQQFEPEMRRRAIDAALDLGYEAELTQRAREIRDLKTLVTHLRRPLWRRAYDKLASWVEGIK